MGCWHHRWNNWWFGFRNHPQYDDDDDDDDDHDDDDDDHDDDDDDDHDHDDDDDDDDDDISSMYRWIVHEINHPFWGTPIYILLLSRE